MPQAKRLITASLSAKRQQNILQKTIQKIDYYMRRNYIAYKSHAKRKLAMLQISPCNAGNS